MSCPTRRGRVKARPLRRTFKPLRRTFSRSPGRLQLIGDIAGLPIIAIGIRPALTGRKD